MGGTLVRAIQDAGTGTGPTEGTDTTLLAIGRCTSPGESGAGSTEDVTPVPPNGRTVAGSEERGVFGGGEMVSFSALSPRFEWNG